MSTLYDVRTTTNSPNDAFLRTYPVIKRRISEHTLTTHVIAKHLLIRVKKYNDNDDDDNNNDKTK